MLSLLLWCIVVYLITGIALAPILAFHSINAMDASAAHGSLAFRLIILPGLVLLWPVVLQKALAARSGTCELPVPEKPVTPRGLRRLHGNSALALCLLLPPLITLALTWRSSDFRDVGTQKVPATLSSKSSGADRAMRNDLNSSR
ncbi:MAG: hypothetical protein ACAI35_20790 [Candidatus Methylacidiphilales bacterium]